MRRSDVRSAKFDELLETLHEDPNRDAIIAHEMGWGRRGDDELEPDDPLVEAFSSSLVVAVKIAGGHGMGYGDDVLCGNIVCCKRALGAAARSVAALQELLQLGTLPAGMIEPLLDEGLAIHALVEQRIAELRERVWW